MHLSKRQTSQCFINRYHSLLPFFVVSELIYPKALSYSDMTWWRQRYTTVFTVISVCRVHLADHMYNFYKSSPFPGRVYLTLVTTKISQNSVHTKCFYTTLLHKPLCSSDKHLQQIYHFSVTFNDIVNDEDITTPGSLMFVMLENEKLKMVKTTEKNVLLLNSRLLKAIYNWPNTEDKARLKEYTVAQ